MFGGVFAPTIVQRTWATAVLGLRNLTSTSVIVSVLWAKTNSKPSRILRSISGRPQYQADICAITTVGLTLLTRMR